MRFHTAKKTCSCPIAINRPTVIGYRLFFITWNNTSCLCYLVSYQNWLSCSFPPSTCAQDVFILFQRSIFQKGLLIIFWWHFWDRAPLSCQGLTRYQMNISAVETIRFVGCLSLLEIRLNYTVWRRHVSRLLVATSNCFFVHITVSSASWLLTPLCLVFSYPCNLFLLFFFCFQPLTSLELWQMVKQHYGHDLGLSHDEMESLQISAESSMQTRWAHSRPARLSCNLTRCAVIWYHLSYLSAGLVVMMV